MADTSIGGRAVELSDKETATFTFRRFPDLPDGPQLKFDRVRSKATFHLGHLSHESVKTRFSFNTAALGVERMCSREVALRSCDQDGTLKIEVDVQVDLNAINKTWKPPANPTGILKKLFESQKGADVTFKVNGVRIEAHKLILGMQESNLAELTVESTPETEIPIDDADPELFKIMIKFHYTEEVPSDFDVDEKAVDLLKLADKHGVVKLKMLMEGMIVESPTCLSKESCLELLFLANTQNCALLLEAAMGIVVDQMPEITTSTQWPHVLKSPELVNVIILYQARKGNRANIPHKLDNLGVATLRKRAHEQGLDVDGSRKVLIKRLKTAEEDKLVAA